MTVAVEESLAGDELFGPDDAAPDDVSAGEDFTEPPAETEQEAPYGWTTDPETGERRPKKRPGRPRRQKTAEELRAGPAIQRQPDKPPPTPKDRRPPAPTDDDVPMPKGGVIAAGINKLYRRGARILRALDRDLGLALADCTRPDPDDPDWLTVGQAWENLAKGNPRIRRFLLKLISGGDVWDLVMAHAPIGVAIGMKIAAHPAFMNSKLVMRIVTNYMTDEDGDEEGEGTGLRRDDVVTMQRTMEGQFERVMKRAGMDTSPETVAAVKRAAGRVANGLSPGDDPDLPPAFRRAVQPKRTSRSKRKAHR